MFYQTHAHIQNKYYDEVKDLPVNTRAAVLFKHTLQNMPIDIKNTDAFAGWYGFEGDVESPKEVKPFPTAPVFSPEWQQIRSHFRNDLNMGIFFTPAHTLLDYGYIIENGLEHYINRVENELRIDPENDCLNAMKISLHAAVDYAARYAELAESKAKSAETKAQQKHYAEMAEAVRQVPLKPARNFLEAVQSVWIMHTAVPVAEKCWSSISLGRMDQYLYPLYKKHLRDGGTNDQIKAILKHLFLLLDSYGDGACALNLGGSDLNGNTLYNELSKVFIEVEKDMALRSPILVMRISPDTPDEILDSVIDFDLFKIGQPTFYGELPCRKAVANRGLKMENAALFSANSCMGLMMSGEEFADMWGIQFNAHLPLELSVNLGKPLHCQLQVDMKTPPAEITSFEQLLEKYGEYFSEIFSYCASIYSIAAKEAAINCPDPLLSALTKGCMESRKDRAVGCKYNTVTVETMGLINVCDALAAIKELVFEQSKYTLTDFVNAAKTNYEGNDDLLHDISKCEKYGMGRELTNSIMKHLCQHVDSACRQKYNGNQLFLPSLHTIDANVYFGENLYATLDGRRKGQPVNKNANPSHLLSIQEHTSVILSATAFDQPLFSGGQPIDLYFEKAWFESKETKDKIKALLCTYFQLGGLQLQVNSIDIDLLKKAHKQPQDYPHVIVRKGGYSVRFSEMSPAARENFISLASKMERTA